MSEICGSWWTTPIQGCGSGSATPVAYLVAAMAVIGIFAVLLFFRDDEGGSR